MRAGLPCSHCTQSNRPRPPNVSAVASYRSSVEPVLGTRLTMRVDCDDPQAAADAERTALAVADRLEAVLSAYRSESPFNQWRHGQLPTPPPEIVQVLDLAASWHRRTDGAFNPCLGSVMRRWRRAEAEQVLPGRMELAELAASAAVLPFIVSAGEVVVRGDCTAVDVHGVAKGWVIDRMVTAVLDSGPIEAVLVDLGGDIRHSSINAAATATVAIEQSFSVADNAAPLSTIRLSNRAVATSGGGRRGWRIDGRWYGHLIDPATGWPLDHQRSCTAVATSAADADAAASACAVLDVRGALSVSQQHGLAVLTVADNGDVWRSEAWNRDVVESRING